MEWRSQGCWKACRCNDGFWWVARRRSSKRQGAGSLFRRVNSNYAGFSSTSLAGAGFVLGAIHPQTKAWGLLAFSIKLKDLHLYYPRVLKFSRTYNRSAYDASYLALAAEEATVFITADGDLYKTVKKDLKWVTWPGDV